jgi:flavodoxin/NAD-dependent dihydropyrimidine dehydrogenase PreA subunit
MKCAIIYFTQTGNTEKIALAIQKGIQQAAGHCDIFKIKDANPKRLYQYDLIGIGAPVFNVENVWAFISDMRFVGGKHVFAFCTHGGAPEFFFPKMIPKLKKRGLVVIGMRDWYANCYCLHHVEPYPTAGHPDAIDMQEAEEFGKEMVDRSKRITAGETGLLPSDPPPVPPMPDQINGKENVINEKAFTSMLKYHKEKCKYPKCRLCMDNCPVDGIDLSMDPQVIANPCMYCEFCSRVCPTGALDMDEWVKKAAEQAGWQVYPILLPSLEKAEAEGRFRRLLPKDKIGIDSKGFTFGYMLHKKHPQWIAGKEGPR